MDKLWFKARRVISVLLVFAMLASLTPVQVFAEGGDTTPPVETNEPSGEEQAPPEGNNEISLLSEEGGEPAAPAPTEAPVTPTEAPATPAPTEAPATPAPATPAPTEAPATPAPTEAPATPTPAATEAPATPAPTATVTPATPTPAPTATATPAATETPAPTPTAAPEEQSYKLYVNHILERDLSRVFSQLKHPCFL